MNNHDPFRLATPAEANIDLLDPQGHACHRTVYLEQGVLSMLLAVGE